MSAREVNSVGSGSTIVQAGEIRSRRIESLRAIAALSVLVGHTYQLSHTDDAGFPATFADRFVISGGYGVFLFFALSGYLLYWPFAKRDFGAGERIDLRRYARNRILRILPLYYVVAVALLVFQEAGGSFSQWWRFMFLAQNFSQETVTTVNGVLWSLVVEIHFYIFLPILATAVAFAAGRSRKRAVALLLGLACASVLLRYGTQSTSPPPSLWRYSLPTTFFFFTGGMLIALVRLSWQERRPKWLEGQGASSSSWLLAAALLFLMVPRRLGFEADVASAAASFLVVGACVLPLRQGRPVRWLEWSPLAALGVASYSLYLWHPPIAEALTAGSDPFGAVLAIVLPLSCVVAFLSYYVVEAPFLRLRRRWARSSARIAEPTE